MPVQKYTAEERGQRGTGSYKVEGDFVRQQCLASMLLCRFSWKMPLGQSPLSMTSHTKLLTLPSMLLLRFPGVWWSTLGVDEHVHVSSFVMIMFFCQVDKWKNGSGHQVSSPPHCAGDQTFSWAHLKEAEQKRLFNSKGYNINIIFVGYKERETALCGQLFPPPWIHLELWGHSSG